MKRRTLLDEWMPSIIVGLLLAGVVVALFHP